jgi:catechol 2,3-dioxygenase-like lactoylglutathione lyase family enzyme
MHASMLDHLNMTVQDVDESAAWYGRVFGFETVEEQNPAQGRRWKILKAGDAMLCIYEFAGRAPASPDAQSCHAVVHFGLRIENRQAWEAIVEREGIPVQYGGPVRWPHSTSWYIEDPNGYEIEVALWDGGVPSFE